MLLGPVSRDEAERQLAYVIADVERGTWTPQERTQFSDVPTFHDFVDEWWALREHQWAPKMVADYRWRIEGHLLPHFKLADDSVLGT
jgi:hypothetical protein